MTYEEKYYQLKDEVLQFLRTVDHIITALPIASVLDYTRAKTKIEGAME